MALEDFDDASEELEFIKREQEIASAPAFDPEDPLNEDVFDFPALEVFDSLQAAGLKVDLAAAAEESVAETDSATQAALDALDALDDAPELIAEEPAPALPSPTSTAPAEAAETAAAAYDPSLDEDLFDFDSIFAGGDVVPTPTHSGDPETFIVPENVEVPSEPRPQPDAVASEPEPAPAPEPEVEPTPAAESSDELVPHAAQLAPIEVPVAVDGGRDKLVMMLAAGFLIVNTALILLAWQANSSFHGTLRDVSRGIAEGLSRPQPAQAAVVVPEPSVAYVPVETTGHTPRVPGQLPSQIQSTGEQTINAARLMLGEGRFLDARRNLNHLLANADLLTLERDLIAEAEFLIAESYELQGSALLELQR